MDADLAREQVLGLIRDFVDQREKFVEAMQGVSALSRSISALQKLILAYADAFPELEELVGNLGLRSLAPVAIDGKPSGADAIRLVLQPMPGYPWLVSQLVNELQQRDWLPDSENPANAVRTALERMVASNTEDVYKLRESTDSGIKVYYVYDPDREKPAADHYYDGEPF